MKIKVCIWLVLLCIGVCSGAICDQWYNGIIHAHSNFSDGDQSVENVIELAKKYDAKFIIFTDHYDLIGTKNYGAKLWLTSYGHSYGYQNYHNTIENAGKKLGITTVAGFEISALNNGTENHVLALKDHLDEISQIRNHACFYLGDKAHQKIVQSGLADVIRVLRENNDILVAAHPNAKKYSYVRTIEDRGVLNGIEFFNSGSPEAEKNDVQYYIDLLKNNKRVFVTAGCDFHIKLYVPGKIPYLDNHLPDEAKISTEERLQRQTLIAAPSSKKEDILHALSIGRTTANTSKICVDGTPPGDIDKNIEAIDIHLYNKTDKIISFPVYKYRNGEYLFVKNLTIFPNRGWIFQMNPKYYAKGNNVVFWYSPGLFITSPYYFQGEGLHHERYHTMSEPIRFGDGFASSKQVKLFNTEHFTNINNADSDYDVKVIPEKGLRVQMRLVGADGGVKFFFNEFEFVLKNSPFNQDETINITVPKKYIKIGFNEFGFRFINGKSDFASDLLDDFLIQDVIVEPIK